MILHLSRLKSID